MPSDRNIYLDEKYGYDEKPSTDGRLNWLTFYSWDDVKRLANVMSLAKEDGIQVEDKIPCPDLSGKGVTEKATLTKTDLCGTGS